MEESRCQKNNKIQRKSEHKIPFPAKWWKCTYDLIAFNWRINILDMGFIPVFHILSLRVDMIGIWWETNLYINMNFVYACTKLTIIAMQTISLLGLFLLKMSLAQWTIYLCKIVWLTSFTPRTAPVKEIVIIINQRKWHFKSRQKLSHNILTKTAQTLFFYWSRKGQSTFYRAICARISCATVDNMPQNNNFHEQL